MVPRRLSSGYRTRPLAEGYRERKSWRPKFQRKLDDDIKVISLLRILSNAIQPLDATATTSVDDLPSLLRLADSERVHDSTAWALSIARQNIHMERRQAKGTVVSVRTVCEGLYASTAADASEAPILLASWQVQTPSPRKFPRRKKLGSVYSSLIGSRLVSTRGKFTASFSGQRLLPVPASSGPISSPNPNLDRLCLVVPATVRRVTTCHRYAYVGTHWHRRRPQVRPGRSETPSLPNHPPLSCYAESNCSRRSPRPASTCTRRWVPYTVLLSANAGEVYGIYLDEHHDTGHASPMTGTPRSRPSTTFLGSP